MNTRDLILDNLRKSTDRVLAHVEDMRDVALATPTSEGGCHTLWILGHLAFIESQVLQEFMLGRPSPLADWQHPFDGDDVSTDPADYPPFDEVLAVCRDVRRSTIALLESLSEEDLDRPGAKTPKGWEDTFGTYRLCFQFVADHWYMHRGQLADARRAARKTRMWV